MMNFPTHGSNQRRTAQVTEIIYQAATDNKDQLRYLAGPNAEKAYARRLEIGPEAFRKEIKQWFLGLWGK